MVPNKSKGTSTPFQIPCQVRFDAWKGSTMYQSSYRSNRGPSLDLGKRIHDEWFSRRSCGPLGVAGGHPMKDDELDVSTGGQKHNRCRAASQDK